MIPLQEAMEEVRNEEDESKAKEEAFVAWGIHSICNALEFLNEKANLVHGNVCSNSIFVTESGDWRLGGFDIVGEMDSSGPNSLFKSNESILPKRFKSPERQQTNYSLMAKPIYATDMFSLGCCIYELFNGKFETSEEVSINCSGRQTS